MILDQQKVIHVHRQIKMVKKCLICFLSFRKKFCQHSHRNLTSEKKDRKGKKAEERQTEGTPSRGDATGETDKQSLKS